MPPPPSGTQYRLAAGYQEAVVTSVSAGLRGYRVAGVDVIDGFPEDEICDGARGQLLLPWPNRVADGRYQWDGVDQQLALTEPDRQTAIHGLSRWSSWQVVEQEADRLSLRLTLPPQTGWPFQLELRAQYTLSSEGLTVQVGATNLGSQPAPFAAGAHPYLSAGGGRVDECELTIPASTFLPTDRRGIPSGRQPVSGDPHDFRAGRLIGPQQVDQAYADLERDGDGRATVRLRRPDGSVAALWVDRHHPYVEIFTGDTLAPDRQRRGLGVEPMTAPPNGLQTGEDVIRLEPAQSVELEWGLRLE